MEKFATRFCLFAFIALSLFGLLLFGSDVPNADWGNEETGFNLQYRLEKGQELKYEFKTKASQKTQIPNQAQSSEDETFIAFTMTGSQANDPDKRMGRITIDDFSMISVQTAMGETAEIERDVSNVTGKSFNLTFTPKGKELDFAGIEEITIDMGPMEGGVRNVKEQFIDVLPDLPDKPVKVGEPWTSTIESDLPMRSYSVKTTSEVTSVIEGTETVGGFECLKIGSKSKSVLEGSGEVMKLPFALKGDTTGDGIWYFAYKEGFFVKSTADFTMDLKIIISAGEQVLAEYPIDVQGKSESKLTSPTP